MPWGQLQTAQVLFDLLAALSDSFDSEYRCTTQSEIVPQDSSKSAYAKCSHAVVLYIVVVYETI